jgi:integrase
MDGHLHNNVFFLKLNAENISQIPNNERLYELVHFMLKEYNLRISEVIRIKKTDLVAPNKIIIKLSKCNNFYVISSTSTYDLLLSYFEDSGINFLLINYHNFYRWFLRKYPNEILKTNSPNRKITHSFRYTATSSFVDNFKSEKEIQALLKHNSIKSQKYYKAKIVP